jgi:hypothetical protein
MHMLFLPALLGLPNNGTCPVRADASIGWRRVLATFGKTEAVGETSLRRVTLLQLPIYSAAASRVSGTQPCCATRAVLSRWIAKQITAPSAKGSDDHK